MSTMKYASAMLAPTGAGRMAERLGLFAAAGALAAAPAAAAFEYSATWTNPNDSFSDSFDLTFVGVNPGVGVEYAVTNESPALGDTIVDFNADGLNGGYSALITSGGDVTKFDVFDPNPYPGNSSGALEPGTYSGAFGSELTISGAPEPEAWALIVGGVALVGGGLRARRRKAASLA